MLSGSTCIFFVSHGHIGAPPLPASGLAATGRVRQNSVGKNEAPTSSLPYTSPKETQNLPTLHLILKGPFKSFCISVSRYGERQRLQNFLTLTTETVSGRLSACFFSSGPSPLFDYHCCRDFTTAYPHLPYYSIIPLRRTAPFLRLSLTHLLTYIQHG